MRRARLPLAFACAAGVLAGGFQLRAQGRPDDRDRDLRLIAVDANGVPPEFSADALIRIAGSGRITDKEWQRYLLDEAFMRAYGAQEQYRRTTTQTIPADSRQGADRQASDTALTRVSLQVRVVQLMLYLDVGRARELFEWIELGLAPGACTDLLVPAVEEYYSALSLLARTTFGDNRADALNFLELYLWRAHLPSEMPSVTRAVQRFRSGRDEAAFFEGQLRLILEGNSADARGFSSANLDVLSRLADLQVADRGLGVPNWYLMDAARDYLLAQLMKPRCADSTSEPSVPAAFNATLRRIGADKDVSAIEAPSLRAPLLLGAARLDPYWQTPDAARLYAGESALRGSGKVPRPLRERLTPEWRHDAEQLLLDIDHWTGTREPERDVFYQKSVLLTGLIELIPPSALRMQAVRTLVEFLRRANADRDRRTLWFAMLTRLLEMAHGTDRREILAALEDSHHATLALYAKLERATPAARADTRRPTDGSLARRWTPAASPSSSGTAAAGPFVAPF
jgi:hypothetical protein